MTNVEPNGAPSPMWGRYVLDNAAPQTPARFSALAELYDATTIRHLERIGVEPRMALLGNRRRTGLDCSMVGRPMQAGRFSAGHRYRYSISGPRWRCQSLTVRSHDIVSDPLPRDPFDLIHARLVLVHLPEREKVLDRMVAALKPGGWLLVEEFDSVSQLPAPDRYPWEVALKSAATMRQVMIERGVNAGFGQSPGRAPEGSRIGKHFSGRTHAHVARHSLSVRI